MPIMKIVPQIHFDVKNNWHEHNLYIHTVKLSLLTVTLNLLQKSILVLPSVATRDQITGDPVTQVLHGLILTAYKTIADYIRSIPPNRAVTKLLVTIIEITLRRALSIISIYALRGY